MPSVPTYDLDGIMHIVSSNKLKTSSGDILNTHCMHLLWKQEKGRQISTQHAEEIFSYTLESLMQSDSAAETEA